MKKDTKDRDKQTKAHDDKGHKGRDKQTKEHDEEGHKSHRQVDKRTG